eukprot:14836853-Heterocapsa_arctica.AAC.1
MATTPAESHSTDASAPASERPMAEATMATTPAETHCTYASAPASKRPMAEARDGLLISFATAN